MLVRDLWYESGAGPGFAHIYDRAVFTIDGARISSPVNGEPAAFDIKSLNGRVAILTTDIDDRIEISGDGTMAKLLGAGVLVEQKSSDYFLNTSSPRAPAVLLNSRQLSRLPGNRSAASINVGPASAAFVRDMLRHTRGEKAEALRALPSGISDVRLFRVGVANGVNNITISPGS